MTTFPNTESAVRYLDDEAIEAAESHIAAHAATEIDSDPPRIPRHRPLPGAGAIVVPLVALAAICAVALGWHLLAR